MTGLEEESYQVQGFDLTMIQPGHSIVLVGTNTRLAEAIIKQLLAHLASRVPFIKVFSCSTLLENFISYIPGSYMSDHFDEAELIDFFVKQKENMSWCDDQSHQLSVSKLLKDRFNTMLIMDKCASDSKARWLKESSCHEVFETHALNHCTIIYRSVEMDQIPASFNHHFDFCFVLSSSAASEHAKLFNRFGGLAQSLATLRKAFSYNITDSNAFVIMKTPVAHVRPEDEDKEWKKYFAKYNPSTTPIPPTFRFGGPEAWRTPQSVNRAKKQHQQQQPSITEYMRRKKETPPDRAGNDNTIDEIIKVFGKHKKIRIEVLTDEEDEGDPLQDVDYHMDDFDL